MNRQIVTMALCGLCGLCGIAFAADAPARKPNVLLICVDDLKPLLGCYGTPLVKTPNIDRLAARGLLFERAYCNQAVCAPSRNSLMTGLRPPTLGIYDLATNFRKSVPDAVTIAQTFMRAGYRTEALGKIMHVGHGNLEDEASWSVPPWKPRGGGYVLPQNQDTQKRQVEKAKAAGVPQERIGSVAKGPPTECADVPDNAYGDGLVADEAIRRLDAAQAKPDAPWFLGVGFLKPHLPFNAPKKYWDLYDPGAFPLPALKTLPEGAPECAGHTSGELRNYSDMPRVEPFTDEQARHLIHGYHAAASFMDAQLGRVLDALDRNGLADNTVIVLWGDHGWHLGDHGLWCKHTNFEQAAHIPLIVAAPGVTRPGTRTRALAETVDLYPTLCELAGLAAPQGLDGASLVDVLKNPAAAGKASVYHVFPRNALMGRAVRTPRHRLVEWKKIGALAGSAVFELYDYEADPAETRNLAADQPEVVAQLRALLARHPEAKPQFNAKPAKEAAPKKPKQDRAKMFESRDKDKDGKLTREEFLFNQPDPDEAPKRYLLFDADKDGFIDREEYITGGKVKK
jgi:iduronate 2-sulfatase